MKKILLPVLMLCLFAGLVGAGTWTYFTDIETSIENIFTAGSLDLEVDGVNDPQVATFFSVMNVHPGDEGEVPVSLTNAGTVAGMATLHLFNTIADENEAVDPELAEGDLADDPDDLFDGELCQYLRLVIAADLDGDGEFEMPLAEGYLCEIACIDWTIGVLEATSSVTINIAWSVSPTAGNIILTDICQFDIQFTLDQAVNHPPVVVVTEPVEDAEFEVGDQVLITADVADDVGITGVSYSIDCGDPVAMTGPDGAVAGMWEGTWDTTGCDLGPHSITVRALDGDGATGGDSVTTTLLSHWWELSDLVVEPSPAALCDDVAFSVTVLNSGNSSGTTTATITVTRDGYIWTADSEPVTLDPYTSITIGFGPWHAVEEGSYDVTVSLATDPMLELSTELLVTPTPTPPPIPGELPVISDVEVINITDVSATIAWNTNEPADSQGVYWSIPEDKHYTDVDPSLVTAHSVDLAAPDHELTPSTLYYYRVISGDGDDGTTTYPPEEEDALYFTTLAPAPNAEFSADSTQALVGEGINFTDLTTGGFPPYSYEWDFDNDGTVDSTEANPTHSYGAEGTYTVSLTVTDDMGNADTETKADYTTVATALDAEFSADKTEAVVGEGINFTDLTTGGFSPYSYEWDFDNDGTVDSTEASPAHSYGAEGTYTVSLTVTDGELNANTETKVDYITVTSAP